jgi:short-subunit dehydrogenase
LSKPAILILGATSPIGRALAGCFAARGHAVALLGRDEQELARIASDLTLRHNVRATAHAFDAEEADRHAQTLPAILEAIGQWEGAVLCVGAMADQQQAQSDWSEARRVILTNFTGCVSALNVLADVLEARRSGFLVGFSSVAGDRGRPSNYLYGAAKAGLSAYLSGLRARLARAGVHVMTVKPGFVDTAMTFGKPGVFLVASPERVAEDVMRALASRKNVLYSPWFWWPIMKVICSIPEAIFKRMKL